MKRGVSFLCKLPPRVTLGSSFSISKADGGPEGEDEDWEFGLWLEGENVPGELEGRLASSSETLRLSVVADGKEDCDGSTSLCKYELVLASESSLKGLGVSPL